MAEIQIKCAGQGLIPLDQLIPMQGNLKELSDANYAKLHDLIVTKGFDSPIQAWVDAEGKYRILDGHQRIRVLRKLQEEGYIIPGVPVDTINADNYKDAKERLLTKVSVYGTVNEDGLDEFLNEVDAIIEPDFVELLDIPGMELEKSNSEEKTRPEPKEVECPNCSHRWFP